MGLIKSNSWLYSTFLKFYPVACFPFISAGVALESPAGLTALDGLFNGYNLSDAWRRAVSRGPSVPLGTNGMLFILSFFVLDHFLYSIPTFSLSPESSKCYTTLVVQGCRDAIINLIIEGLNLIHIRHKRVRCEGISARV